jgi:hypothetical protein
MDSDDPYITSGVKVALSVLALVANVAFVVYIAYLLLRRQEGKVQDAPAPGDSPVTQVHKDDSDAVSHIQQDFPEKRLLALSFMAGETAERLGFDKGTHVVVDTAGETAERLSFDKGTHVVVEKDDGTTHAAVTAAKSFKRRMVPVIYNDDPSQAVDVFCTRVRPLEQKEHTPVEHEAAAVRDAE